MAEKEIKIRFLEDRVVQDEYAGTEHETKFFAGKTYVLPESSAVHWLTRGCAEMARAKARPPAKPKPVEKTEETGDDKDKGTAG